MLCSDGSAIYRCLPEQLHLVYKPINFSAGIRVVDNAVHTQDANAYDNRLPMDQPTTLREYRSMTTARYNQPSWIQT